MIGRPDIAFRYRLAAFLHMTVARLNQEVDSVEFAWWQAYDQLHPLDLAGRAELSAAIIASLIHNSQVDRAYQAKSASHFMTDWGARFTKPVDNEVCFVDQLDSVFEAIAARAVLEAQKNGDRQSSHLS